MLILGTNGNDTLTGSSGADTISGGDGNDFLDGQSGDDSLFGGSGNDTLIGGDGNDALNGDSGDDFLAGGAGDDIFYDPAGHNVLDGGAGNDIFTVSVSTGGANTVTGGAGQDLYYVDPGSPSLNAGSPGQAYVITDFAAGAGGDLLYVLDLAIHAPTYNGGNPFDPAVGFLRLVQSGANTLLEGDRDGAAGSAFGWTTILTLQNVTAASITNDNFTGLIAGTNSAEVLQGSPNSDLIIGGGGNDTLIGGDGDDALDGGAGADRLEGGRGNDLYYVDNVNDVVVETSNDPAERVIDTVIASVNYSLANVAFVENLTLSGMSTATTATGNALDNVLTGNALNNTLNGLGGNDTLDGGGGVDTAIYSDIRSAYTIGSAATTVSGPGGSDTLSNIERLKFADKGLAFDLGPGEAAGNAVRIIGAAFDAPNIQQHPDWVGIGLDFFDGGMSLQAVSELVVQIMGLSNTAFVTTVFQNVVEVLPSAAERDSFVGLLQGSGGTMTQAELLMLAANADMNAQNINLVGLQQAGVEFV